MSGLFGDDSWFNQPVNDQEELYQGPTQGQMLGARLQDVSRHLAAMAYSKPVSGPSAVSVLQGKGMTPLQRLRMLQMQQEMDITAQRQESASQALKNIQGDGGTQAPQAGVTQTPSDVQVPAQLTAQETALRKQIADSTLAATGDPAKAVAAANAYAHKVLAEKIKPQRPTAATEAAMNMFNGNKKWAMQFEKYRLSGNDDAAQELVRRFNAGNNQSSNPPNLTQPPTAGNDGAHLTPVEIGNLGLPKPAPQHQYVWKDGKPVHARMAIENKLSSEAVKRLAAAKIGRKKVDRAATYFLNPDRSSAEEWVGAAKSLANTGKWSRYKKDLYEGLIAQLRGETGAAMAITEEQRANFRFNIQPWNTMEDRKHAINNLRDALTAYAVQELTNAGKIVPPELLKQYGVEPNATATHSLQDLLAERQRRRGLKK